MDLMLSELVKGAPQISQERREGWLWNVHMGHATLVSSVIDCGGESIRVSG